MTENQKKLQEKENEISKLKESIQSYKNEIIHLNKMITDIREENRQLTSAVSDYDSYFQDLEDQEKMTITRGRDLLINQYHKIKCPITRREVSKQFMAYVITHQEQSIENSEKSIENISKDVKFRKNNINNIKEFADRLLDGEVVYE
jgi:chromosome segregation ATPase